MGHDKHTQAFFWRLSSVQKKKDASFTHTQTHRETEGLPRSHATRPRRPKNRRKHSTEKQAEDRLIKGRVKRETHKYADIS